MPVGVLLFASAVPHADSRRGVVIDPEDVQGLANEFEVAVLHEGPVCDLCRVFEDIFRVGAVQQRVQKQPVAEPVDATYRFGTGLAVGTEHVQVQGDGEVGVVGHHLAQC